MLDFSSYTDMALLIARVITGIVMVYYGFPKIRNLRKNAQDFVMMGFKPGMLWGTLIAILEFFGGFGIIFGVLIPIIAFFFALEMIAGAIWKIRKTDKPFTDWSYDLLLLALMLVFFVTNGGNYIII